MTLAPFVRIVAQGKGRARPLTLDEARDAMTVILSGNAAPEALGALLMVLRLMCATRWMRRLCSVMGCAIIRLKA